MDLTARNLDSFEGKNIGVFKDNITEDVLNEWESKYGLHTKHINVSTTTEIMGGDVVCARSGNVCTDDDEAIQYLPIRVWYQ